MKLFWKGNLLAIDNWQSAVKFVIIRDLKCVCIAYKLTFNYISRCPKTTSNYIVWTGLLEQTVLLNGWQSFQQHEPIVEVINYICKRTRTFLSSEHNSVLFDFFGRACDYLACVFFGLKGILFTPCISPKCCVGARRDVCRAMFL